MNGAQTKLSLTTMILCWAKEGQQLELLMNIMGLPLGVHYPEYYGGVYYLEIITYTCLDEDWSTETSMLVVTYISLFLLSALCVAAYLKLRISKHESTNNPTFLAFQRKYIPVYLLVVLGDWLQGMYFSFSSVL